MRHRTDADRRCVVPMHGSRPVKPGTLKAILRGARIELSDFLKLL